MIDPRGVRDPDGPRAASLGQKQGTKMICPSACDSLNGSDRGGILGCCIEYNFCGTVEQSSMAKDRQMFVVRGRFSYIGLRLDILGKRVVVKAVRIKATF